MRRLIVTTLYLLIILIPLFFTSSTFELFEFPKFIILLAGTILITVTWLAYAITTGDFLVRSSSPKKFFLIDWAVLAVLITQAVATITSINPYTSFWGYYSRFHQGLLTTICYTIIYFAAIKWLDKNSTQKLINISIKTAILISLIAILEHYNVSITCMLMTLLARFQNDQVPFIFTTACWGTLTNPLNRSFATLGQPNWLAAYLIPNLLFLLYQTRKNLGSLKILSLFAFGLMLLTLIFTGSKSGIIAFALSYLSYWLFSLSNSSPKKLKSSFIPYSIIIVILIVIFGSPYTSKLIDVYKNATNPSSILSAKTTSDTGTPDAGTALENGGTNSGDIRKIVWSGALQLIKEHPLLGTGPETFAYTYYWVRPVAHNYTSEWDYLYNKAHNEYLNIAATTGLIGLSAYIIWHYAIFIISFTKVSTSKKIDKDNENTARAYFPLVGGAVIGFAVTNFFGFSVIPVYLLMIIVSALANTIVREEEELSVSSSPSLAYPLLISACLIYLWPIRIFYADFLFNKGKTYLTNNRPDNGIPYITKAIAIRPKEDLFHSYLSEAYAAVNDKNSALEEAAVTRDLNPYHLNYYKSRAKVYLAFAQQDKAYYQLAATELEAARKLAPTDPKLAYNLGLIYSRLGDLANTEKQMYQSIELKKDYQEPYYALTLIYEQTKNTDKIPALMQTAHENLATYSALLKEKMDKYSK